MPCASARAGQVELHTWERVAEKTLEGYERALELPPVPAEVGRR